MPKVQLTAAAVERFKAAPGVRTEYFDKLLPGVRIAGLGTDPEQSGGCEVLGGVLPF
jgi:hypothetical protein